MASNDKKHVQVDNVIYANFGGKTKVDVAPSSPAPTRSERDTLNNAGKFLYDCVVSQSDAGRQKRARDYEREGHVFNTHFGQGMITGDVAGSQNEPFHVTIGFPYRSTDDNAEVSSILAKDPSMIDAVRHGVIAPQLVDSLMGESARSLNLYCDCPDSAKVCKHIGAVALSAIAQLEADPQLIFKIRGMDLAQLEQAVTMKVKAQSQENSSASYEAFWDGSVLPPIPHPKKAPALDDSDMMALHKAMRLVSYTSIDELRAVADIEDIYDYLTEET